MEPVKPSHLNIDNAIMVISDPDEKDFSIGYMNPLIHNMQVDEYALDIDQVETLYRMCYQFLTVNRPDFR